VINWLGKLLFGKYAPSVRRKHVRFLGLALLLAVVTCVVVADFLYYLQQRSGP